MKLGNFLKAQKYLFLIYLDTKKSGFKMSFKMSFKMNCGFPLSVVRKRQSFRCWDERTSGCTIYYTDF